MKMRTGQLWECGNGACGCEILVVARSAAKSRVNPRCCCGSVMKKSYLRPEPRPHAGGLGNGHRSEVSARRTGSPAGFVLPR